MKWTTEKFIELLKRHDAGADGRWLVLTNSPSLPAPFIYGWLNLESLCEELNAGQKEQP